MSKEISFQSAHDIVHRGTLNSDWSMQNLEIKIFYHVVPATMWISFWVVFLEFVHRNKQWFRVLLVQIKLS